MKNFKTVQEWLESTPTEKEVARVMKAINREFKQTEGHLLRVEKYEANQKRLRLLKISTLMETTGIPLSEELKKSLEEATAEYNRLEELVPYVPRPSKKDIKEALSIEVEPKVETEEVVEVETTSKKGKK